MGIQMEGVNFSYGNKRVLTDINLNVHTGGHIGIIGSSGCGKSTLLKLISGLYPSQHGYLEVEGTTNPIEIRRYIALVMQNSVLLPASIKENITCGHPLNNEIIKQACDTAMLTEWMATLPDGIDTYVGERNSKVSGGQAQRIAIARALAKVISMTSIKENAPILLLDEATSALDSDTSYAVLKALKAVTKDMTVITVTHRPETLIDINQWYRLEEGRLVHA